MSLASKLAEVYLEVSRFAKTKAVTGAGPSYKYTPVEEIADKLREEMGKRGIVMVPASCEVICSEDAGTTKSGTTRWRHVINMTWTLTDGEDSLTVSSVGESMDTGDKGMNKAQTAARKYALIGAFQLSTGDDPDVRHPEPASRPARAPRGAGGGTSVSLETSSDGAAATPTINERQRARMFAIAGEHDVSQDDLKDIVRGIAAVESSKDIPRDRYEAVCEAIANSGKVTA